MMTLWAKSGQEFLKPVTRDTAAASHDTVIRVYDNAGKVIETHEHNGGFKDW